MDILLPFENKTIDDAIDYLVINGRRYGDPRDADIWLPRFEVSTEKMEVNKQLTSLGLSEAVFDGGNYPGMQKGLFSSFIRTVQSAKINVDESGSVAAAVTVNTNYAVAPAPTSGVFEFHADHPFLYIIRESSTKAILFAGKYGTN